MRAWGSGCAGVRAWSCGCEGVGLWVCGRAGAVVVRACSCGVAGVVCGCAGFLTLLRVCGRGSAGVKGRGHIMALGVCTSYSYPGVKHSTMRARATHFEEPAGVTLSSHHAP